MKTKIFRNIYLPSQVINEKETFLSMKKNIAAII